MINSTNPEVHNTIVMQGKKTYNTTDFRKKKKIHYPFNILNVITKSVKYE